MSVLFDVLIKDQLDFTGGVYINRCILFRNCLSIAHLPGNPSSLMTPIIIIITTAVVVVVIIIILTLIIIRILLLIN